MTSITTTSAAPPAPLLAAGPAPELPLALARREAFDALLARDKRAERRLAWLEAPCLALAVGVVLLARLLAERL